MPNYARKSDLKIAKCVDASKLAKEADLASFKSVIEKLGIYELKTYPANLSKLSDAVKLKLLKSQCYLDYW